MNILNIFFNSKMATKKFRKVNMSCCVIKIKLKNKHLNLAKLIELLIYRITLALVAMNQYTARTNVD
jgi:hypothetical protein